MKKFLFALVILLSFNITVFAGDNEAVYDEAKRTIKSLNNIREGLDLDECTVSEPLKDMANSHSKYMSHNNIFSSVEDRTKEHYKGRYPWDRASYFNYDSKYVYEFIVKDINNFDAGITRIIADPMTRNILFNPTYTDIGMSIKDGYGTFVVGGSTKKEKNSFIIYPYDGQENVKSQNSIDIYKNYLKNQNRLVEDKVGMPITITYYGSKILEIKDIKIQFRNKETDKDVAHIALDSKDYYFLDNTLVVLPIEKYDYNSEYELSVKFRAVLKNGEKKYYDKKIKFSTDKFKNSNTTEKYITRGDFVEKLVKNEKYKLIEPLEYKFSDVKVNDKLSKYIYTAAGKNLISGFENGRFESGLNITKEQVYSIMVKAYALKHSSEIVADEKSLKNYSDYDDISPWARAFLAKADKIGILIKDQDKINPNAYLTEEEYEKILDSFSEIK